MCTDTIQLPHNDEADRMAEEGAKLSVMHKLRLRR